MNKTKGNYPSTLFSADSKGNYLGLSKKYEVQISEDSVNLSKLCIPLLKIQKVERIGSGMFLQYLDPKGLPTRIFLTTSDIFGIGRKKKIDAFISAVKTSAVSARKAARPEEIASSQEAAPADTCHDCGARGGVPGTFRTMRSLIFFSQWSIQRGVYCKQHATRHGISALLKTGFLGWWSLRGIFFSPAYISMNASALWRNSTLSKPMILALTLCAVALPALIVAFFMIVVRAK